MAKKSGTSDTERKCFKTGTSCAEKMAHAGEFIWEELDKSILQPEIL
jgi:hypothetical protein